MPLYIRLDTRGAAPIYQQVIRGVRHAMALGAVQVGDRLPSVRELAQQLTVNPNTVAKAYRELEHQGLVDTRQGSGSYVRDKTVTLSKAERRNVVSELLDEALVEARHLRIPPDDLEALIRERVERLSAAVGPTPPEA